MKYGPISRITLAQILGLSQGAVSRITSDLIYAGVIEETPMPSGKAGKLPKGFVQKENTERRGRPQTGLQVIANARSFVGMKINATHISAVAVNAIGQIITGCHDLKIEDASPQTVVALIKQLTTDCSDEAEMAGWPKPCAVGISLGGHIVDGTVVTFAPFMHWSQPWNFPSWFVRRPDCLPEFTTISIRWWLTPACLDRALDWIASRC